MAGISRMRLDLERLIIVLTCPPDPQAPALVDPGTVRMGVIQTLLRCLQGATPAEGKKADVGVLLARANSRAPGLTHSDEKRSIEGYIQRQAVGHLDKAVLS